MGDIKPFYGIVEEALMSLGITPEQSRNDEEGQWTIYSEELELYIDLWSAGKERQGLYYFEAEEQPILQIISPFCQAPQEKYKEFLEELLDINIGMMKANLVMREEGGVVCVKYRDIVPELKKEDVVSALNCVSYYAELLSKAFFDKYQVNLLHRMD